MRVFAFFIVIGVIPLIFSIRGDEHVKTEEQKIMYYRSNRAPTTNCLDTAGLTNEQRPICLQRILDNLTEIEEILDKQNQP